MATDGKRSDGFQVSVRGASMLPALVSGERIRVEKRLALPGDVVVFLDRHGQCVAHRLLSYVPTTTGLCMISQGDACAADDGLTPVQAMMGRAALPSRRVWAFSRACSAIGRRVRNRLRVRSRW